MQLQETADHESSRKPSGGGLRVAITDVLSARVPSAGSLLGTWLLLLAVLTSVTVMVAVADVRLAKVLSWASLPASRIAGLLAIGSLLGATAAILRLPLTLTGDAPAYLHRERRRLRRAVILLAAGAVFGLYWAAGRSLPG